MISETVLRKEDLNILAEKPGIMEAEHFIAVIKREPFDYTKRRENLFPDVPAEEFLQKAADFSKENKEPPNA